MVLLRVLFCQPFERINAGQSNRQRLASQQLRPALVSVILKSLFGSVCLFLGRFDGASKPVPVPAAVPGGITSDDEEAELEALNEWVEAQGLPRGQMAFDYTDPATGEQLAVFDLAWPDGLQIELSQSVAVLIDEGGETLATAARAGYRCFTRVQDFRNYVATEISPAVGAVA